MKQQPKPSPAYSAPMADPSSIRKVTVGMKNSQEPRVKVCEPVEKGSGPTKYLVYKVVGCDFMGEFEIFRRFREFYMFRDLLIDRWPGLYIPPMPSKKAVVIIDLPVINLIAYREKQTRKSRRSGCSS